MTAGDDQSPEYPARMFLAGAIAGLLARDGFDAAPAMTDGVSVPAVWVGDRGHVFHVTVTYEGSMSTEQLTAIAARNGVDLTPIDQG